MGRIKISKIIITAALTAGLIVAEIPSAVHAESRDEGTTGLISAITILTETDINKNTAAIQLLLEKYIEKLPSDDPLYEKIMDLDSLIREGKAEDSDIRDLIYLEKNKETLDGSNESEGSAGSSSDNGLGESPFAEENLPIYETESFLPTFVPESVLVDVPGEWGNNASGRTVTSYSPVNDSGAISPFAGTISISFYPMDGDTEKETYDI